MKKRTSANNFYTKGERQRSKGGPSKQSGGRKKEKVSMVGYSSGGEV